MFYLLHSFSASCHSDVLPFGWHDDILNGKAERLSSLWYLTFCLSGYAIYIFTDINKATSFT